MKKLMNDTYTCVDLSKILGQSPKRKNIGWRQGVAITPLFLHYLREARAQGCPPKSTYTYAYKYSQAAPYQIIRFQRHMSKGGGRLVYLYVIHMAYFITLVLH